MASIVKDRVHETNSAIGTGDFIVTGAVDASYVTFASVCANNDTFHYCAVDDTGKAFEIGTGTYITATKHIVRGTIEASSNAGSLVNFANPPKVFITASAAQLGTGATGTLDLTHVALDDYYVDLTGLVGPAGPGSINDVGRNLIHNPLFNIAQRGAGAFTTSGIYTLDRWRTFFASDTNSFSQFAMNDTNRTQIGDEAAAFMLLNAFTGNAAAAAQSTVFQYVEGVRRLAGKTVIISFYAQANTVLKLGVSLDQNFGTGGSPSTSVQGIGQSVTLSTSWARYSLIFTVSSIVGKTLGTAGDDNTALVFWFSSGSTNATRAGNIGVQSGSIGLWGVQLEIGTTATALEKPDPQQDLAKCQRFYQYGQGIWGGYTLAGTNTAYAPLPFPVQMRSNPTVAVSPTSGGNYSSVTAAGNINTITLQISATASATTNFSYSYTASADL